MGKHEGFYWWVRNSYPVVYRYVKDLPDGRRIYFGDVYHQQGIGPVESRIYHDDGDTFKIHKSISAARAYVEAEERACR